MEPDNSDDLLSAIKIIQESPRESFLGREYVKDHFNRDKLALDMLNFIR